MIRRMMMGTLVVVAGFLTAWMPSAADAEVSKIGYVLMEEIRARAEVYQEVGTRIQQIVAEQEQAATQKQGELQRLQDQLQRQQSLMTEQTRARREGQIRQKLQEYQQWAAQTEQDIVRQQAELVRPIDARVIEMIKTVAEANGYDLVLDGQAIAYMRDVEEHNLTGQIIEAMNQE